MALSYVIDIWWKVMCFIFIPEFVVCFFVIWLFEIIED